MRNILKLTLCFLLIITSNIAKAGELTFELPDNAQECFHEIIKVNETAKLEYQVVSGGNYDVDVILLNNRKAIIYQKTKSQFDSHEFSAQETGVYTVCFSNEFSTFTHKLVYMDLQVGKEPQFLGIQEHATVLSKLDISAENVHGSLNLIIEHQTHHRLREAQGRKRAEDLNDRVLWWSLSETAAILIISISQVLVLRNFFSEKRPSHLQNRMPRGK